MERRQVNPWTWQDQRGFSQAWLVEHPQRSLYVSGQVPLSADGELVGEGDLEAQLEQTFKNLEAVLAHAGMGFSDVVRLTVFLRDISQLPLYGRVKARFISGSQPASTAVQVEALAMPAMMVEIDAIAVA